MHFEDGKSYNITKTITQYKIGFLCSRVENFLIIFTYVCCCFLTLVFFSVNNPNVNVGNFPMKEKK